MVELKFLKPATVEAITEAMRGFAPHVFHYIGHGEFKEGRGMALLENDEGYALPVAEGATNRKNIRAAKKLLENAGWTADDQGILKNAEGRVFTFDILLTNGAAEVATIGNMYIEQLKPLGITATLTTIDHQPTEPVVADVALLSLGEV